MFSIPFCMGQFAYAFLDPIYIAAWLLNAASNFYNRYNDCVGNGPRLVHTYIIVVCTNNHS